MGAGQEDQRQDDRRQRLHERGFAQALACTPLVPQDALSYDNTQVRIRRRRIDGRRRAAPQLRKRVEPAGAGNDRVTRSRGRKQTGPSRDRTSNSGNPHRNTTVIERKNAKEWPRRPPSMNGQMQAIVPPARNVRITPRNSFPAVSIDTTVNKGGRSRSMARLGMRPQWIS